MRTVVFFRTESGRCPTEEFLDSLEARHAQKVVWIMQLIEELDAVPRRYLKKLPGTDEIWEIRVPAGDVALRFLGFLEGSFLVISHGFPKKSRKTPTKEIALAEKRRRQYLRRGRQ